MEMRKCAVVACVLVYCASANADAPLEDIAIHDNSIIAELKAMRERIETLQARIDSQQKKLKELQGDKLIEQDSPKVSMAYNRPTITSADGRSSLAIRAVVQADSAHYSQDDPGPLETDFRRGSVGVLGRENAAARRS